MLAGQVLGFVEDFFAQAVAGEGGVGRGGAGQGDAGGEGAGVGVPQRRFERGLDAGHGVGFVGRAVQVHFDVGPAEDVQHAVFDRGDAVVGDGDQGGALGAGFADVAALQVAGEDDPGVFGQFLALVDVAERPVVVAVGFQARQVAGGVAGVGGIALGGGVQQADVEQVVVRWRIGPGQVVGFVRVGEALAVDGDPDRVEADRCGPWRGRRW